MEEKRRERKEFWKWKNLLKKGSFGKEWSAGYTVTLDKFSLDLSRSVRRQGYPETIGHEESVKQAERILSGEEDNNVLIVGEPGSGRKSIVRALAVRSALGEGAPETNYCRFVQLDIPLLLSQSEDIEKSGAFLKQVFQEVISAGNVILVIDEFHNFISGRTRPGVIDISGILSSYLDLPLFRIVAITSFKGLHRHIEQHPSLLGLLEKVEVTEISREETLSLLEKQTFSLEAKHKKFISYQAIRQVVEYCDRYMADTPFPEKAMELLEETVVYLSQQEEKIVSPSHVAKIVSEKTDIPVGKIKKREKKILLELEKLIHQRIINQNKAVDQIANALRRARSEISIREGPMGSFLFLGPTGVGKTETAKSLAEIYFGSEDKMIRLDMSEFQSVSDIPRLIGAPEQEGLLTTKAREDPFSLVLLDEIEKAHPNILNLFLQVLDEGFLTDGIGRKVDFKNTIIIATSNAGYRIILQALREEKKMEDVREELLNYLFQEGRFRPEFINRFDAVVLFKALSKQNLLDISGLLLKGLKKDLIKKDIELMITHQLKEKIVQLSYDPKFGAREMKRVIQDKVGNNLAKAILAEKIKRGDKIEIDPENFDVKPIS